MSDTKLEDIVSLAKRRGFVYQGSEIYGGLAGTWDYGPLGVQLKRNVENLWWQMFVESRDDMYGLDAAILMNQKVWQASGHKVGFVDPITRDIVTQKPYRADHLLEEAGVDIADMNIADMTNALNEKGIKSPDGNPLGAVGYFNMMVQANVGASSVAIESDLFTRVKGAIEFGDEKGKSTSLNIEPRTDVDSILLYDKKAISYLRPETAQGIFTNFKNVVDTFSPDLPFGIAQIGKAFRNEISPRDFTFRSREFGLMEIEYFVEEKNWKDAFEEWVKNVYKFLDAMGIPKSKVHELEVPANDRAHYSKRTVDFEFDYSFGRKELLGLAYRTDYDLKKHQEESGKKLQYIPKGEGKPFLPHVIEPAFGIDRLILALLTVAYTEDEVEGEKRIYLKLPANISPVKVAVSPLLKNKPELVAKAREVYATLKAEFGAVMWDDNGNIGKRYRRQDEIGTPYCVTIDFDTLEDDTVTVRHRDTTKQERIKLKELISTIEPR